MTFKMKTKTETEHLHLPSQLHLGLCFHNILVTQEKIHICKLEAFQSTSFRTFTKALGYISKVNLHTNLHMPIVNVQI